MARKKVLIRLLCMVTFLYLATGECVKVSGQKKAPQGKSPARTLQSRHKLSPQEIARKFLPSIVQLRCDDGRGSLAQGSGFYLGVKNLVMTNHHVIKGMMRGTVQLVSGKDKGRPQQISEVLYFDEQNDLALLEIDEAEGKRPELVPKWGEPKVGETVFALGNPLGLTGTISQGLVSSEIRRFKSFDLLQISAPISPGSSGGPVINEYGEVIGVTKSFLVDGQSLNFAIPQNTVRQFVIDALEYKVKTDNYVRSSNIQGAWLVPDKTISDQPGDSTSGPKMTLEETTDWLKQQLVGTRVMSKSGAIVSEIVSFDITMCHVHLTTQVELGDSTLRAISIANLYTAERAFQNSSNGPFDEVRIQFGENIRRKVFANGNEEKPLATREISIPVIDERASINITKALSHAIVLCGGGSSRSPF